MKNKKYYTVRTLQNPIEKEVDTCIFFSLSRAYLAIKNL
jgi:hypothetical protein